MHTPDTPGKRLRALRTKRKLTQEYLAAQLRVSRQAVSKWENDQALPDTGNLMELAKLLDCPVDYLLRGDTPTAVSVSPSRLPRRLRRLASLLAGCGLLLYLAGIVTGEFNHMVSIPINKKGDRLGLPLLYYGRSDLAAALLFLAFLLAALAGLLFWVAHILQKEQPH